MTEPNSTNSPVSRQSLTLEQQALVIAIRNANQATEAYEIEHMGAVVAASTIRIKQLLDIIAALDARVTALEAQRTPPAATAASAFPDHYDPVAIARAIDEISEDIDDPEAQHFLTGLKLLNMLNMPDDATPPRPVAPRLTAAKLTDKQRKALQWATNFLYVERTAYRSVNNKIHSKMYDALVKKGVLEPITYNTARVSDAGRAALDGAEGGR